MCKCAVAVADLGSGPVCAHGKPMMNEPVRPLLRKPNPPKLSTVRFADEKAAGAETLAKNG